MSECQPGAIEIESCCQRALIERFVMMNARSDWGRCISEADQQELMCLVTHELMATTVQLHQLTVKAQKTDTPSLYTLNCTNLLRPIRVRGIKKRKSIPVR